LKAQGLLIRARIERVAGHNDLAQSFVNQARALDPNVWPTSAPPPEILFRPLD